jgi:hypothetical protein
LGASKNKPQQRRQGFIRKKSPPIYVSSIRREEASGGDDYAKQFGYRGIRSSSGRKIQSCKWKMSFFCIQIEFLK